MGLPWTFSTVRAFQHATISVGPMVRKMDYSPKPFWVRWAKSSKPTRCRTRKYSFVDRIDGGLTLIPHPQMAPR